MIEPIISDRQCLRCLECKPTTSFSPHPGGRGGLQPYCKACRSDYNAAMQRARRAIGLPPRGAVKRPLGEKASSWLIPSDPRPKAQVGANAVQRAWKYPVEPTCNLTWRIVA